MVHVRLLVVIGLALSLVLPQALRAEDKQCDFQPDIVALADYVLKNREALPRFKKTRFGATSAYLKLHYQTVPEKEAGDMLMSLFKARVARADELMFAWAIHFYGVDAAVAMLGREAADALLVQGNSPSVLRAAVVKEGISALTAQWINLTPVQKLQAQRKVPTALLDKFDTYKNDLGRQAEASNLLPLAAGLAATQTDPAAWADFASRVADKQELQQLVSLWYWTPALVGNPQLKRGGADTAEQRQQRELFNRVAIAAARMPERDFLLTYLNQTGKVEESARVADTILTVAADKGGEPWTMDRAWLTAYLELLTVTDDPTVVDGVLKSLTFSGSRHYSGSIRDVLDWMMAADALKAYALGRSGIKAKPDLISPAFGKNWNSWQTAADVIRAGGDLGLLQASPNMQAITAELLFATGKQHQLAGFLTGARPDDATVNLAEDFAGRMDRICYGYLNFPAEGVIFPDTPLFRFD